MNTKKIKTNWGLFKIGEKVKLSSDAKENENYKEYFDTTLIISDADLEDEGLGIIEPIISFVCENGAEFPFSLYGYEIRKGH